MKKYIFRECTMADMDEKFNLRKAMTSSVLDRWLQAESTVSEQEKDMLKTIQAVLLLNSDAWGEQELAMHFIGPIFTLICFTELYRFNLFAERSIKAIVSGVEGDIELRGEPDGMIATGYRTPKIPMFAFTEYKRTLDPNGDPVAQTLAAMLVGQALNKQADPVYGCFVIGNIWRFLVLEEKNYTISHEFSAVTDQIFDIFRILKALKLIIMDLTAA